MLSLVGKTEHGAHASISWRRSVIERYLDISVDHAEWATTPLSERCYSTVAAAEGRAGARRSSGETRATCSKD